MFFVPMRFVVEDEAKKAKKRKKRKKTLLFFLNLNLLSLLHSLSLSLSLSSLVATNLPAPENNVHLHALLPVPRHPDPHFVPGPPLVQGLKKVPLRLDLLAVERRNDVAEDEPSPVVAGSAPDARGGGGSSRGNVKDQDARLSDLAEGLRRGDGDLEKRGWIEKGGKKK